MSHETHHGEAGDRTSADHIVLPASTSWPMVFAFGLTLMAAAVVTDWPVGVVGLVIAARAIVGWWHTVIPHEHHEVVLIDPALRPAPIMVESRSVVRLHSGEGGHRRRVPEEIHPYSAGLWGGLAGGAAMAALAALYGLIFEHSIWYPINLLAGVVIPGLGNASLEQLKAFNGLAFLRRSSDMA